MSTASPFPQMAPPSVRFRHVLNVGSGPAHPGKLHAAFRGLGWREIRLDIEPQVQPDILASMVDMRAEVPNGSVDAVWSSHNLEHLHAHEVPMALGEFARVLRPDGFALVTCPDMEEVARFILERGIEEVVYASPAGPVTPIDMLWGHGASIEAGYGFMAHRTGFTLASLARHVLAAGFAEVRLSRSRYALWALCLMPHCRLDALREDFVPTEQADLVAAEEDSEGSAEESRAGSAPA